MVARNAWGSKSRLFLAATLGIMALRFGWSVEAIGVWRAIFLLRGEPLGWRAGDIGTSFCLNNAIFILSLYRTA
jgi:hypothetical protein